MVFERHVRWGRVVFGERFAWNWRARCVYGRILSDERTLGGLPSTWPSPRPADKNIIVEVRSELHVRHNTIEGSINTFRKFPVDHTAINWTRETVTNRKFLLETARSFSANKISIIPRKRFHHDSDNRERKLQSRTRSRRPKDDIFNKIESGSLLIPRNTSARKCPLAGTPSVKVSET